LYNVGVHIVVYIFAGLFIALALGLCFAYYRSRHPGLLLMAGAYGLSSARALGPKHGCAIPGLRFRIGFDAILGLIPGLGDLLGVLLSSYIVREAARIGAPPSVLVRMAFNVAVEGIVGLVPLVGDVFDAAWKANQRNLALLDAHLEHPQRSARSSRIFVGALIAALIAFIGVTAALAFLLARAIWQAFS
jgi:hypothetical protein